MANIQPSTRFAGSERGTSLHSRGENEKSLMRNGIPQWTSDENRAPPTLPKAFESMLKTTTETGEIGLFSIKPSRVPQSTNAPRRFGGTFRESPSQRPRNFQSYSTTGVDDRRRLPSYARDASSEVISMYETASQKSAGRVFDEPDRSYSMTQTYSSYSLSNHRSYASLRSQPDGNSLLQRPRSPFAYPTRLKRPGFRPSSPALTDGGEVDYSRRAEIDRMPYSGGARSTSSPSSLYAQKRKPPPSLRPDTNRSTPSLLNQYSPARRSPSPHMRQGNYTPTTDWNRRNGPGSLNTSPARSTLSLASTVNLYQPAPTHTNTTTPGRIPPPSPLYYDYTEDFDIDDYNRPELQDPPPQFRIEKTIPEDRPVSSGWQLKDNSEIAGSKTVSTERLISSLVKPQNVQDQQRTSYEICRNSLSNGNVFDAAETLKLETPSTDNSLVDSPVRNTRDKKVIRLSRLGLGAQELNRDVEQAFGLGSSPSFELAIPSTDNMHVEVYGDIQNRSGSNLDGTDNDLDSQSARTSSYSLNTHLQRFPTPPLAINSPGLQNLRAKSELSISFETTPIVHNKTEPSPTSSLISGPALIPKDLVKLHHWGGVNSPPESKKMRTVDSEDSSSNPRTSHDTQTLRDTPQKSSKLLLSLLDDSPLHKLSTLNRTNKLSSSQQAKNGRTQLEHSIRLRDHRGKARRMETATLPIYGDPDVPNFSHQIPRKLMSRSESPMLAPKPISPARQLKLKNSIPHLMKTLPPLPAEHPIRGLSPPVQLTSLPVALPCQFSPLIPESMSPPVEGLEEISSFSTGNSNTHSVSLVPESLGIAADHARVTDTASVLEAQPPLKFRLKMRNSATLRPTSPPDSRPWNLEESYPWAKQKTSAGTHPPLRVHDERPYNHKPPKFKLKVTRASNSTLGTVRVKRDSAGDTKHSTGLHLPSPKDLFTPNSGFDGMFRQVSKHLYPRREIVKSETESPRDGALFVGTPERIVSSTTERKVTQASPKPSATPSTPLDARSCFSEASSKGPDWPNVRKRLTNLRDRITVPYNSRTGSQSYDDLTWRGRSGIPLHATPASVSHSEFPSSRLSTEFRRSKRFADKIRTQKLIVKVSEWFNGARSRLSGRVKSRFGTTHRRNEVQGS